MLVDEINRAPARTQAALLEALEERQVTLGPETHRLPDPFIVLGTLNEAEADAIYPLPAAQRDRFLLKVLLDFPTAREEVAILDRFAPGDALQPKPVATIETVRESQIVAASIYCAPRCVIALPLRVIFVSTALNGKSDSARSSMQFRCREPGAPRRLTRAWRASPVR